MTFQRLMAQMTVSDLTRAEEWYSSFFGRRPDDRPMDGLIEWHLTPAFGLQVYADPERAGRSAMVLDDSDVDGFAAALTEAGIAHDGVQPVTSDRVLPVTDPDGNQIVVTGPLGG